MLAVNISLALNLVAQVGVEPTSPFRDEAYETSDIGH